MRVLKKKIYSLTRLIKVTQSLQKQQLKIVFTNGCFDILHPGHVQYLEQARSKGDFLVVALDSDAAVRKLKGKTRPINNLASRMLVVAALESVDAVISFENANPVVPIKKIRPNVLVKGGDWKIKDILGSKEVLSWKGQVFSLQFTKGKSTTNIIKKITHANS